MWRANRLQRSNDYRHRYFSENKGLFGGLYFCTYCGLPMIRKKRMQVDHIHAVHKVRRSFWLRRRFKRKEKGVNCLSNLTVSCARCNARKGAKGGFWVLKGRLGCLWVIIKLIITIVIVLMLVFVVRFAIGELTSVATEVSEAVASLPDVPEPVQGFFGALWDAFTTTIDGFFNR